MNHFEIGFVSLLLINGLCSCAAGSDSKARLHLEKANRAFEAGNYQKAEREAKLAEESASRELKKAKQEFANDLRAFQQMAERSRESGLEIRGQALSEPEKEALGLAR